MVKKRLKWLCTGIYDIIILEWVLPIKDGLTVLKEFRRMGHDTPRSFFNGQSQSRTPG